MHIWYWLIHQLQGLKIWSGWFTCVPGAKGTAQSYTLVLRVDANDESRSWLTKASWSPAGITNGTVEFLAQAQQPNTLNERGKLTKWKLEDSKERQDLVCHEDGSLHWLKQHEQRTDPVADCRDHLIWIVSHCSAESWVGRLETHISRPNQLQELVRVVPVDHSNQRRIPTQKHCQYSRQKLNSLKNSRAANLV